MDVHNLLCDMYDKQNKHNLPYVYIGNAESEKLNTSAQLNTLFMIVHKILTCVFKCTNNALLIECKIQC